MANYFPPETVWSLIHNRRLAKVVVLVDVVVVVVVVVVVAQ